MRTLPARYRVGKRLFRTVIAKLSPRLHQIPRARAPETIDYAAYLRAAEERSNAVSRLTLDDSRRFLELFDACAVSALIHKVCVVKPAAHTARRWRVTQLLPMSVRLELATAIRYLTNPGPTLSRTVLLLRLCAMAEALRHLDQRARPTALGDGRTLERAS
jgi:hypothetical protein